MKKILVTGLSIVLFSLTFNIVQAKDDHSSDIFGKYWSTNKEFSNGLMQYARGLGYITAVSKKVDEVNCQKAAEHAKSILENKKDFVAKIQKALEIDLFSSNRPSISQRGKGVWKYQYDIGEGIGKNEHCDVNEYYNAMEAFQAEYSNALDEYIKNNSSASPREDLK